MGNHHALKAKRKGQTMMMGVPKTLHAILEGNHRWTAGVFILTVIGLAFLLLYRLDIYPAPWHDEANYLKIAKNYALNGVYADFSSEGNRYTGPIISTGPTVILPVAMLFRLFGVDIPLARLFVVACSVLLLVSVFGLGSVLRDRRLAFAALLLTVLHRRSEPITSYLYYSRNVLGEVPGMLLILAGLWLWLRPGRRSVPSLIGVGVIMGLASITKNQYAVFALPSLLLAWILNILWYRRRDWRYFVVPGLVAGAIFLAWTYSVFFLLDADKRDVYANLDDLRAAANVTFFILDPQTVLRNIYELVSNSPFSVLFLPSALFGLVLGARRDEEGQRWGVLSLFLLTSTAMFIFSVGWPRYAFPVFVFSAFFTARLFYSLTDGYHPDWKDLREAMRGGNVSLTATVSVLATGLLVTVIAVPLFRVVRDVTSQGDDTPYRVAEYLNDTVPENDLVETWEQVLAVLTDHTYHFPPQVVESAVIARYFFQADETLARAQYDFRDHVEPDFVVVGPFSSLADVYTAETLEDFELVRTIDSYDIYQRR